MPAAVSKTKPTASHPVDPKDLIKGYGALKGQLALPDDIDWTAPIYAQVLTRQKRRPGRVTAKPRNGSKKARSSVAA